MQVHAFTEEGLTLFDDEPDVHEISRLAMREFRVYGLPIRLHSAASKAEAIRFATIDSSVALMSALFINAAILTAMSYVVFVLGLTQAGNLISNITYNLTEAGANVAAVVRHAVEAGATEVEVTAAAEEAWVTRLEDNVRAVGAPLLADAGLEVTISVPQGVDMASRQVHNGISLRIVRQYDINNDRLPCRIDVLYGYSVIRPQMAVRLWG